MDEGYVIAEHSNVNVYACFKCKCGVLGNEEVTKSWIGMEQFISLFSDHYVSKSSFITP